MRAHPPFPVARAGKGAGSTSPSGIPRSWSTIATAGRSIRSIRPASSMGSSAASWSTSTSPRIRWSALPVCRSAATPDGSGRTAPRPLRSNTSVTITAPPRRPPTPATAPRRDGRKSAGTRSGSTTSPCRSIRSTATRAATSATSPSTCSISRATRPPGATASPSPTPRRRSPGSTSCTARSAGPRSPTCTESRGVAPSSP